MKKRYFVCQSPGHFMRDCPQAKNGKRPPPKGPPKKQVGKCGKQDEESKDSILYTHSASAAAATSGSGTVKASQGIPYLNPDPFKRYIGSKNLGQAFIDGELTTCLLDNGAQLNFMTPGYAAERGFNVLSLDHLAQEAGGALPPPPPSMG